MNRLLNVIVMILVLPSLICGCSTVFGRQHDEENVSFDSNVQNVEVICSGKRVSAPGSIPLMQSKSHACVAQAPGYEKKVFSIKSGISWAGFGHSTGTNTAIWGWWTLGIGTGIGWLIDSISGAMRNLKEEAIYLDMKPLGTTSTSERVLEKTIDVGKAVVNTPVDAVRNTASTALDTTLSGGAQKLGIVDEKKEGPTAPAEEAKKNLKVI